MTESMGGHNKELKVGDVVYFRHPDGRVDRAPGTIVGGKDSGGRFLVQWSHIGGGPQTWGDQRLVNARSYDEKGESVVPDPKKAKKETAGKPAFDILFQTPIRDVAAVFTYGSEKYKEKLQWRKSLNGTNEEMVAYVESLMGAAIRHIEEQFRCGSDYSIDHESDLPSLAHAVADLMMALDVLKKASLK